MSAALRSELRLRDSCFPALLIALDYKSDESLSLEQNAIDCLNNLGWCAISSEDGLLTFEFQPDDGEDMDWEVLVSLAAFLEDGSYYEERYGDYVVDSGGEPRSGIVRAWMEGGQLKGIIYALIPTPDGQRMRQPVESFDPRMA